MLGVVVEGIEANGKHVSLKQYVEQYTFYLCEDLSSDSQYGWDYSLEICKSRTIIYFMSIIWAKKWKTNATKYVHK